MIWPFVADTARINELSGSPIYQVEERPDAQGRIHRFASAGLGPLRLRWEDGYSEWQENRRIVQVRDFQNGPLRRFQAAVDLYPDGSGSRVVYTRNQDYVPRPNGVTDWLAGPKIVHFDRVEWTVMPDPGTAAAALQAGEVDWWENPPNDLLPVLGRSPGVRVEDGPFAETKEGLAGVFLLEVPDLDAAIGWAEQCPGAQWGVIEVRPTATAFVAGAWTS